MAAGEGIETVLSLRCILPTMSMIAALSASHLTAFVFPKSLRRLYIARDDDNSGDRAIAKLSGRAIANQIEAIVLSPRLNDFNDDLRTLGIETFRETIRAQLSPDDVTRFLFADAMTLSRKTRLR